MPELAKCGTREYALADMLSRANAMGGTYKKIATSTVGAQASIPIYIGHDFWHRVTGIPTFYLEMVALFVELFEKENYSGLLEDDLNALAEEIETKYFSDGIFDIKKI